MALCAMLAAAPASAETVFQADGAALLGYASTTLTPVSTRQLYADVRPALTLQLGSPRLAFRAGYLFAGDFTISGSGPSWYSNQLTLSLAAELSRETRMTAGASVLQGSTAFQLTLAAPEAGQPAFRAPGNLDLVAADLIESLSWDASPKLRLAQGFLASASAPQDALDRASYALAGSVSLHRLFPRDAVGVALRSGFSVARPLAAGATALEMVTSSLLGSWNHDFDPRWSAQAAAGVEQVIAVSPGHPDTVVPAASLTALYFGEVSSLSLTAKQEVQVNLQTGTASLNDEVVLRAAIGLDRLRRRQVAASAGYLRARALGDVTPGAAAQEGHALQGDLGLVWAFSDALLGTARYSVATQWVGTGLARSLVHTALVGLTVHYSNVRVVPSMPTLGRRVDGSDAIPFPGDPGQR